MNDVTRQELISPPLEEPYNNIFERLVDQADQEEALEGFVAYVYYKLAKREWVLQQVAAKGKKPSPEELRAYISTWTESRVIGVKTEARQALAAFANYIVEKEKPKILQQALEHKSFWRDAWVACVGAFFWTMILIAFALILKMAHIDLIAILKNMGVPAH